MTHQDEVSETDTERRSREFSMWMLESLGIKEITHDDGLVLAEIPERLRDQLEAERLEFVTSSSHMELLPFEKRSQKHVVEPGSWLFLRLIDALRQEGSVVHAEPVDQPHNVHEFVSKLFSYYTFEGGRIQLGGCTLQKVPLLRFTFLAQDGELVDERLRHLYITAGGRVLDDEEVRQLGLDQLVVKRDRPNTEFNPQIKKCMGSVTEKANNLGWSSERHKMLLATAIWCSHAEGRLEFAARDTSVEVAFHGWARMFANGNIRPPAYRCAECGRASYQLAETDDGRVTVADGIGVCEETQERVLESDLAICEVTGRRVLKKLLMTCPVTSQQICQDAATSCGMCCQLVSPDALRGGRCTACRRLQPVKKEDARMARILGEYPSLDRWSTWRLSETAEVYTLLGSLMWRQLLVVLEKESLEVVYAATAGRFIKGWSPIEAEQAVGRRQ